MVEKKGRTLIITWLVEKQKDSNKKNGSNVLFICACGGSIGTDSDESESTPTRTVLFFQKKGQTCFMYVTHHPPCFSLSFIDDFLDI